MQVVITSRDGRVEDEASAVFDDAEKIGDYAIVVDVPEFGPDKPMEQFFEWIRQFGRPELVRPGEDIPTLRPYKRPRPDLWLLDLQNDYD